jgi:hypothetical protein
MKAYGGVEVRLHTVLTLVLSDVRLSFKIRPLSPSVLGCTVYSLVTVVTELSRYSKGKGKGKRKGKVHLITGHDGPRR